MQWFRVVLPSLAVFAIAAIPVCGARSDEPQMKITPEHCKLAAIHSKAARGVSMLVMVDGKIVFEDYPTNKPDEPHELASGTKSFSGIAAVAACEDGILKLDEKVSDTITEWKIDPAREPLTIRQLLTLTSGIKGSVGRAPTYAQSLQSPVTASPGKLFQYGAEPFQIFGEVMRRKLAEKRENMVDYLKRRVLSPAGVTVGAWRAGGDGYPLIPAGGGFTAREWAKFGEFVRLGGRAGEKQILKPESIDICFKSTDANPMYGLTWWLNRPIAPELRAGIRTLTMATDLKAGTPGVPSDLVMAAGAGKQRLYISRKLKLVAVRQADGIVESLLAGDDTGFSDTEFLKRLTLGQGAPGTGAVKESSAKSGGNDKRQRLLQLMDRNGDGKVSDDERAPVREFFRQKQLKTRSGQ